MHLSSPGGRKAWAGSGFRFLVFVLSLAWRPSSLEPVEPVQTRRVQGLALGLLDPEQDLSRPHGCKFGLEAFMFLRDAALAGGRQAPRKPV